MTTLGTGDDEQMIDALHGNFKSNFMLHYNFPPYSVGEAGRLGPTGRREIGHGKLAWRALQAVLPAATDFPTQFALCPRSQNPTVQSRWRRFVVAPVDDGRWCSAEGTGCRCCDGLILEETAILRGSVGHPGRRRSPGRHGLQSGGYRKRHHVAADGHQSRGHHTRDYGKSAGTGQRRAVCISWAR